MLVIVGESGAGKSSVAKELKKYGYKNVVTYTTRPMRDGEKDGIDYHFIDDRQFEILQSRFCLVANYRGWKYATDINDLTDESVIVVTPAGMRELNRLNINLHSIYINVPRRDRLIKLLERGDDIEEAYRRSLSDVGQFDNIENEVDLIVTNKGYTKSVKELCNEIVGKL